MIAAWPSFALIAAHELLMRQVRHRAEASTYWPAPGNAKTVGRQAQGSLTPLALAWVTCPAVWACVAVGSYPARKLGEEGVILTGAA